MSLITLRPDVPHCDKALLSLLLYRLGVVQQEQNYWVIWSKKCAWPFVPVAGSTYYMSVRCGSILLVVFSNPITERETPREDMPLRNYRTVEFKLLKITRFVWLCFVVYRLAVRANCNGARWHFRRSRQDDSPKLDFVLIHCLYLGQSVALRNCFATPTVTIFLLVMEMIS